MLLTFSFQYFHVPLKHSHWILHKSEHRKFTGTMGLQQALSSLPFSFVLVTQLFIQKGDNVEFVNSWQLVVIYYGMGLEMAQSP